MHLVKLKKRTSIIKLPTKHDWWINRLKAENKKEAATRTIILKIK